MSRDKSLGLAILSRTGDLLAAADYRRDRLDKVREGVRGRCVDIVKVAVLRELMRNLIPFRNLYEDTGQDIIVGPEGVEYSLWDLERLYESLHLLPTRQAEAIEMCLVQQYKEREVALAMGVSETNPVAMYATDGLKNLIKMMESGKISWARKSAAA